MEFSLSDLTILGSLAAVLTLVAWIGDHRRRKRKDLDAVGFFDWTTLFFIALLAACLLLGGAARLYFTS